jgi:putative methylase
MTPVAPRPRSAAHRRGSSAPAVNREPIRQAVLAQTLSQLASLPEPEARREQVATPAGPACTMLYEALARGDLAGRSVADLGCGTGVLAIGAALLGAGPVVGVDADPRAVEIARANARRAGVACEFLDGAVATWSAAVDTVVMNPPFGAQQRHADRPFWDAAYRAARRRIYAFALEASRTFIADSAVARRARVEAIQPIAWRFPRTFPHHRKRSVELPVDLWVLSPGPSEDERNARE